MRNDSSPTRGTLLGLDDPGTGESTDEERARRERTRDGTTGITSYATDEECRVTAFALNGRLFTAGLLSGHARPLAVDGTVFDPRPDPTASRPGVRQRPPAPDR